ncbi:hypothetical protein [Streptomyces sp. DASNCL29]|uniref:hypothetical protein n=1 Tax=Streptomyces sp. DASNCL29 TaxID=2583819 RepID=UPI0019D2A618|nr:hypothetical protein [Streptomyces sp. DASNCL29]
MPPTRVALGAATLVAHPAAAHAAQTTRTAPRPATDPTPRTGDPLLVNPEVSGPYGTADSGPRLVTALGFAPPAGLIADRHRHRRPGQRRP